VTGDAAFYYGKTSHAVGALMASRLQSLIGKFDRSGVSGSTGRGRSQALESKVRFADDPPGTPNLPAGQFHKCIGLWLLKSSSTGRGPK
jgi:hypothetical protein